MEPMIDLGVALLDETYGREWPKRITKPILMWSGCLCVIGQASGDDYFFEKKRRNWDSEMLVDFGFNVTPDDWDERGERWRDLNSIWTEKIAELRRARGYDRE